MWRMSVNIWVSTIVFMLFIIWAWDYINSKLIKYCNKLVYWKKYCFYKYMWLTYEWKIFRCNIWQWMNVIRYLIVCIFCKLFYCVFLNCFIVVKWRLNAYNGYITLKFGVEYIHVYEVYYNNTYSVRWSWICAFYTVNSNFETLNRQPYVLLVSIHSILIWNCHDLDWYSHYRNWNLLF